MKHWISYLFFLLVTVEAKAQQTPLWHNKERYLRYHPEERDIVILNGNKKFNRALYGGNTAFRAETGDLPEFAMYMPGMGGNIKLGIIAGKKSKWITQSENIKAVYRAGKMLYYIKDPLLNDGQIKLEVIALYDREGMVIKCNAINTPPNIELMIVYGGASGKRFSRDGDIGADPESSFYLKPEYCLDNIYKVDTSHFTLLYGFSKPLSEEERYEVQHQPVSPSTNNRQSEAKRIVGIFPRNMMAGIYSANSLENPLRVLDSAGSKWPIVAAKKSIQPGEEIFFFFGRDDASKKITRDDLDELFLAAEQSRKQLAERIKINTPDSMINTLGPVLGIAADAIWEDPSYMHGAVAWRMRLNGWRGAYIADVFGWHDRAKRHFNGYALSQVITPPSGPVVADTALNLARQLERLGTSVFSSGYISRNPGGDFRAHHYDMNLVFIDQLLNHFNWTGDTAYVREMFPLIKRHLAWEKRNFDGDGDGLYDSYAAIWASDALQYSGGGVTHSSAYNYRTNKVAAVLANILGEDNSIYKMEAEKILKAINDNLWMPSEGSYAEYKDLLGNKLLHPSAGIWTFYHAIDEGICNPFQAYQSLQYVETEIPHIPILAKGLNDSSFYTISTTNWQPYTWSLNNVALAEVLHTALAYWQAGRFNEAYRLWKGNMIESMYMGSSPGNIQQLSFYDAIRGELYRDFADPIGMAGRTLVEGLFGISPDALKNTLVIKPGFPGEWKHASISTPDISFDFKKNGMLETYVIKQDFERTMKLKLQLPAYFDNVQSVQLNNKIIQWTINSNTIGQPYIEISIPAQKEYRITVQWKGRALEKLIYKKQIPQSGTFTITPKIATDLRVYDPQGIFSKTSVLKTNLSFKLADKAGNKTFFVQTTEGAFKWWQPIDIHIIDMQPLIEKFKFNTQVKFEKIDLAPFFNDYVNNIFKNKYLSPRPSVPTLQLPLQGIGNWAYPLTTANISDTGLRIRAGIRNEIITGENIPFTTPSDPNKKNILFTSLWDNYPDSTFISLKGKSSHAFFVLAGTTNPMQSRLVNGEILIKYMDGTSDKLSLENPSNWWPIEQDYYTDGFAFTTGGERPLRVYLKTGEDTRSFHNYTGIKGFSNYGIDGGAATILDLPLNKNKELKGILIKTIANDVIIGLMALTLIR